MGATAPALMGIASALLATKASTVRKVSAAGPGWAAVGAGGVRCGDLSDEPSPGLHVLQGKLPHFSMENLKPLVLDGLLKL